MESIRHFMHDFQGNIGMRPIGFVVHYVDSKLCSIDL